MGFEFPNHRSDSEKGRQGFRGGAKYAGENATQWTSRDPLPTPPPGDPLFGIVRWKIMDGARENQGAPVAAYRRRSEDTTRAVRVVEIWGSYFSVK